MKWPKISIIMPSYNQGEFIQRSIDSVLNQRYPNLEFIVMDGGSTDKTVRVLKKYGKRITWLSEPDEGQADAINKGLKRSTGDILAYLNSDDTYEPGALKTVAQFFIKHPKAQFVYGRGKLIDTKDSDIGMYNDSQMSYEKLFAACGISQPTAFWRREVYSAVGEFDVSLQYTMDYDYWIRTSKRYTLHFLKNSVLANTRIHAEAKTSKSTHLLHKDAVRTVKKHFGKVHYDWINTLADSRLVHLKNHNDEETSLYRFGMALFRHFYHARLNHTLSTNYQSVGLR